LAGALDCLPDDVKVAAVQYTQGSYRDLFRSLERGPAEPWSVILRVLCLLRMAQLHETIGETDALDYLRDRVIPRVKQVEIEADISELRQRREWLELFCLGHGLPSKFWDALAK